MPISGIQDGNTAVYVFGKGYLPLQSQQGDVILGECLYVPQTGGTL